MVKKTVQTLQHQAIKWYNIYVFRDTKHVEMENLLYDCDGNKSINHTIYLPNFIY